MKMIVTRREIRYGGKPYRRGQSVDVRPEHVRVLKLLKKVDDPPGAPVGHVTTTRALFAEQEPAHGVRGDAGHDEAAEPKPKPYRTRRLKAEG